MSPLAVVSAIKLVLAALPSVAPLRLMLPLPLLVLIVIDAALVRGVATFTVDTESRLTVAALAEVKVNALGPTLFTLKMPVALADRFSAAISTGNASEPTLCPPAVLKLTVVA